MTTKPLAERTLNEIIKRIPGSIDVLNAFLLDTCCGEHLSLNQAAKDANASLEALVAELQKLEVPHA